MLMWGVCLARAGAGFSVVSVGCKCVRGSGSGSLPLGDAVCPLTFGWWSSLSSPGGGFPSLLLSSGWSCLASSPLG